MTLRTKNTIALSLLGAAIALGMAGFSFSTSGSFTSIGPKALATPMTAGAIVAFLFFNWFLIRTLTGIRLLGGLSKDQGKRVSVRAFSWLLLAILPILLAGPVWIAATQGATLTMISGGAIFIVVVFFYLLIPASNGTLAIENFKKLASTSKK